SVTATNSVSLGAGSTNTRANTVSVGDGTTDRQIINVAPGTQANDAATVGQVQGIQPLVRVAQATATTALTTADNALAVANADMNALAGSAGSGGTASAAATLAAANASAAAGNATTLAAANAHTDTTAATTLASANTYTNTQDAALQDDFTNQVNGLTNQVNQLSSRINTVGALSAALSMIGPDGRIAGDNQFSMGGGSFRNQQAVSVGFSRLLSPHASVRLGAAFANGENEAGVGFNIGW
ncbi:MAG TPA: YadA C-terminal domain-containing protein, partial [Xanthomonadaceae bacterium]|nr:YadA C-terminal domain-containing protein [Xanthomonadaceae bacterium]